MKFLTFLISSYVLLVGGAGAQSIDDVYGTFDVEFQATSAQGEVLGCHLNYKSIIQDFIYNQGAPYAVFGNIGVGISEGKRNLVVSTKVITNQMNFKNSNAPLIPAKPYFAFLQSPSGANNAKSFIKGMDSETKGGIFSVFKFDKVFVEIYTQILEKRAVSIVFNRKKNGQDIVVPIDLTVVSTNEKGGKTRSDKMVNDFGECVSGLLREVSKTKQTS
jgi:hypothetical protein